MENYLLFRTALEPLNKRVLEIEESIYPHSLIQAGEEKMLYGVNDMARLSVMDKIVHYYSPLIKKMNEVEGN